MWKRFFQVLCLGWISGLMLMPGLAGDVPNKSDVLKKAIAAYYHFQSHNFTGFSATLEPNWNVILKNQYQDNPSGTTNAVQILSQIQFSISFTAQGDASVTHQSDVAISDDSVRQSVDQLITLPNQVVDAFQTWKNLAINSILPDPASDYTLEDQGDQYLLSFQKGPLTITVYLGKDYKISYICLSNPGNTTLINPIYNSSSEGFVLAGYSFNYSENSGGNRLQSQVDIESTLVQNLPLPSHIHFSGTYNGQQSEYDYTLSNPQLNH